MSKRKCDKRAAVALLAEYGVDVETIAKALCLKPSTVRVYLKQYGRVTLRSRNGGNQAVQQATEPPQMRLAPKIENQWVELLRSKGRK